MERKSNGKFEVKPTEKLRSIFSVKRMDKSKFALYATLPLAPAGLALGVFASVATLIFFENSATYYLQFYGGYPLAILLLSIISHRAWRKGLTRDGLKPTFLPFFVLFFLISVPLGFHGSWTILAFFQFVIVQSGLIVLNKNKIKKELLVASKEGSH